MKNYKIVVMHLDISLGDVDDYVRMPTVYCFLLVCIDNIILLTLLTRKQSFTNDRLFLAMEYCE